MKEVTVKVKWLISVVKKNRDKHKAQYDTAFENYRKEAVKTLERNLDAMKAGKVERVINVEPAPQNHTKDYDRVIMMLKNSVNDEVTLEEHEFDNYVMDQWNWKGHWAMANSKYLGG